MNPDDVKAYLSAHFGGGTFQRIEWIDDTSANLLFASESSAQEALVALAAVEIADPTQLPPLESLPAKSYGAKPTAAIQVRFAVVSDKKVKGAAERSRFYLLHPEYDPEERRRREGRDNRRYRDRDGDRGFGRDRRGSGRRRDDDDDEPETFDASLYDDDEDALAKRAAAGPPRPRRDSRPDDSDDDERRRSYARRNADKELFPDRRTRNHNGLTSRNRSASPLQDEDGDRDMDDAAERSAALRNREKARSIKERITQPGNSSKELFPSKVSSAAGSKAQMDQIASTDRLASGMSSLGLDGARDFDLGELLRHRAAGEEQPIFTTTVVTNKHTDRNDAATKTSGGNSNSSFSIKGLASQRGADQGLAIKGMGASAKELFPDKFGTNAGKELFAELLGGRGRRRQRAEDMFR